MGSSSTGLPPFAPSTQPYCSVPNTALLLRHVLAPPKGELGSCQRGPSWNSSSAMDLGEQGARAVSAGHVPKGREDPETQCVPANTRP